MKQLYIRKGNTLDTQQIIILGEESELGGRDLSGYRPNKGTVFDPIVRVDKYSGNKDLTYVHATPNVLLNTASYQRDYDIHKFVKEYCTDLVKWDGETNEGLVRSREAFIIKGKNVQQTCNELYERIETEVHGGLPCKRIFIKRFLKVLWWTIKLPFKIMWFVFKLLFLKKTKRRRRRN